MWQTALTYILERMKEKSFWVSAGTSLTGMGIVISPDHWQMIMGIGMIIPGILTTLLPARVAESGVKPDPLKTEPKS